MNRFLIPLFVLMASQFTGRAQVADSKIGIGQWASHLAYNEAKSVTQSEESVYYACQSGIIKFNKTDFSSEYINTINGLTEITVERVQYYQEEGILIIVYSNGNMDLRYEDGRVFNMSAILDNKNIVGEKRINHIFCENKKIYLSCVFGLVVYDLEENVFRETIITPSSVNACTSLGDTLFISTDDGIYKGLLSSINLQNFTDTNTWIIQDNSATWLKNDYRSTAILRRGNSLYADYNDTLIRYKDGQWSHIEHYFETTGVQGSKLNVDDRLVNYSNPVNNYSLQLSYDGKEILIGTKVQRYYTLSEQEQLKEWQIPGKNWWTYEVVKDQNQNYWAADNATGLLYYNAAGNYYELLNKSLNTPYRSLVTDMGFDGEGRLWCAGSRFDQITAFFNRNGIYVYDQGFWDGYNAERNTLPDTLWDVVSVLHHQQSQRTFFGSWMSGLIVKDKDNNFSYFDQYNSPLSGASQDELRTRITGMAIDEDGNLWMSNHRSQNTPVVVYKADGTWTSFGTNVFGSIENGDIAVDRFNNIWVQKGTGGITVFQVGDWANANDDQIFNINSGNSELPSNDVNCIQADNKGTIWVGTNDGIVIFNCGSNLFDQGCSGSRPVITLDNFNAYLLEGEKIKDIAVDGANRKWIATDNGVFLLSEDGYEQLLYFNESNSPLFSNSVTAISVSPKNGLVYISTSKGLLSYKGEATQGDSGMSRDKAMVYPNPVNPNYQGPIAVKNLAEDVEVKITDVSGRLVYETRSLGGQVIWNGMDYNGRRAQSGVYLVFANDDEGNEKMVTKILFLN